MTPATLFDRIAKVKQNIEEYIEEDSTLEPLSESITLLDTLLDDLAKEVNDVSRRGETTL